MDAVSVLVTLLIVVAVVAVLLWLIGQSGLDADLSRVLRVVVVGAALIYLVLALAGRAPLVVL